MNSLQRLIAGGTATTQAAAETKESEFEEVVDEAQDAFAKHGPTAAAPAPRPPADTAKAVLGALRHAIELANVDNSKTPALTFGGRVDATKAVGPSPRELLAAYYPACADLDRLATVVGQDAKVAKRYLHGRLSLPDDLRAALGVHKLDTAAMASSAGSRPGPIVDTKLGDMRLGWSSQAFAISPESDRLIVTTSDKKFDFHVFDLLTGAKSTLAGDAHTMFASFSPDGSQVATLRWNDGLTVSNAETNETVFWYGDSNAYAAEYSPDGRYIALGSKDTVSLIDAANGKLLRNFNSDTVRWLAFSPDSQFLFVPSTKIEVRETQTFAVVGEFDSPNTEEIIQMVRSGNTLVVLRKDCTVELFDATTRDRLHSRIEPSASCVALSPDGTRGFIGTNDGTILTLDTTSGKREAAFASGLGSLNVMNVANDGTLYAGDVDAMVTSFVLSAPAAVTTTVKARRADDDKTPEADIAAALTERLVVFDPASGAAPAEQREGLSLLLGDDLKFELDELLPALLVGVAQGKVAPVDLALAKEPVRKKVIAEIEESWPDEATQGILRGLLLKNGGCNGAPTTAAEKLAVAIAAVPPSELQGVFTKVSAGCVSGDYEFESLPVRAALSTSVIDEAVVRSVAAGGVAGIAALLDRAAVETPATQKIILDTLQSEVTAGTVKADDVRTCMTPELTKILLPQVDADISAAVATVISARSGDETAQTAASTNLASVINKNAAFTDKRGLYAAVADKLYAHDLTQRAGLKEVDAQLGGVAAKSLSLRASGPTAFVGGIQIPMNTDPQRDLAAVPRQKSAEMVLTDTTNRNLRVLAAAWRTKKPVLLEGPTSAGKTSAVRYIAYKTSSPYRRINLSYYTDVSDLLGRYVGGEKRFVKADLEAKSEAELRRIATDYELPALQQKTWSPADVTAVIAEILAVQEQPRWVDGAIIKAMKNGEVLLLDEINLARPEVLERLNSLFDDDGNITLTEHKNEVIKPHANFRIFGTMNPAGYAGRAALSAAMRSRWNTVQAQGLDQKDITKILTTRYGGQIPDEQLASLVAAHDALARAADEGTVGRKTGGIAFTLRNLFKVAERFVRYQGQGLDDAALMRRETDEVYLAGLIEPEDVQTVTDLLNTAMPSDEKDFYANLAFSEDATSFTSGDVTIGKLSITHGLVPSQSARLLLTPRTTKVLYQLMKAFDMGENVALIGERACGKTAIAKMFAMLRGQPYYRQLLSASTDASQLIGGYDNTGWKDGLLMTAAKPGNPPGVFLGDELNLASPALLERLNSVLDDERKLVLAEKEGEEIILDPDFRFVAAMNPPTKEYGGRQKLSKAMQNRFTSLYVPDLAEKDEQKEIMRFLGARKGVDAAVTDALVDLHHWCLNGYADKQLGAELRERDLPVLSIRQLSGALDKIAELKDDLGLGDAYMIAIETTYAAEANPTDFETIMAQARKDAA